MLKHYNEFLRPKSGYKPMMTKEAINATPENWLNFYPHPTFVEILQTLLGQFEHGDRSLWMTGAYGTGKSHAALVIQKLFMDDDERVMRYFEDYGKCFPRSVVDGILKWRRKKTLVVYEVGTDTVHSSKQFLMHLERAVKQACRECGYATPSLSGHEKLLARIREDEARFFRKRDEIQGELMYLTPDIDTFAKFESACRGKQQDGLLQDAERVFEHDDVFITSEAEPVLDWIAEIRRENSIGKVVFLWDEFSSYIDHAKGDLKTFEKMAEAKAQQCGFHFVPITHMELGAFLATGSESTRKASDRYEFRQLQIPANQVFRLGAHAFDHLDERAWMRERERLWSNVSPVVESYMASRLPESEAIGAEDFKEILPLHPMCAYLLRHMSEKVGSNQRSFFDYLCASNGQSEFQKFIEEGGPDVANRQYLMVDYLWRYFMERSDLGRDSALQEVEAEFNTKKFALNLEDGCPEERVYKAVLLYSLMEKKLGRNVQPLLSPTVENVERAFQGDGAVLGVRDILKGLEQRNCFTLSGDRVMPLVAGQKVDTSTLRGQFTKLLAEPVGMDIQRKVNSYGDALRYEVRAYDGATFKPSDVKNRSEFGEGTPKGGNKILVNFLLARDRAGAIEVPEVARRMARQFSGLRIVFAYVDNVSFCDKSESAWEDYITLRAQANAATEESMRGAYEQRARDMFVSFSRDFMDSMASLTFVIPSETPGCDPFIERGLTWKTAKNKLADYRQRWFSHCPDPYAFDNTTLLNPKATGLKSWASAGLGGATLAKGPTAGWVKRLEAKGIGFTDGWFDDNPDHPFTAIKELLAKKLHNAVGAGTPCSIRKIYIELQRAPYGLEKNAYSAFVLGFALRPWLSKNLQWTDGRVSQPLNADSLAEIVEKVVQNDGAGTIRDERLICRLSSDEKAFTRQMSEIFGLSCDSTSTPESVLAVIGEKVRTLTDNVPLWTLPPYVRSLGAETAQDAICSVVETLCELVRMSSRSKDGARSEKVKAIGSLLSRNEGLAASIRRYVNPKTFGEAFDFYLEKNAAELIELARQSGDLGREYRKAVLSRFSQDASWLWNEGDVMGVLADVKNRYRFICEMQALFGVGSWMDFATAQARLRKALFDDNRVSIAVIATAHPFVAELASASENGKIDGDALERLCGLVETQRETVAALFRDVDHAMALDVLVKNLGQEFADVTAEEWRAILAGIDNGARLPEETFRTAVATQMRDLRDKSEGRKLLQLWKDRTGANDADAWSAARGLPADVLFMDVGDAKFVIGVLREVVAKAPSDKVRRACDLLAGIRLADEAEQRANFLQRHLPKRYRRLGVEAMEFADWLRRKLGDAPNRWQSDQRHEEAVETFVRENYDAGFRPQIENRIREMSDAEVKTRLLKLIADNPDVGLALMD